MTKPKKSPPVGIPGYGKGGVTKGKGKGPAKKGMCPHCGKPYKSCSC